MHFSFNPVRTGQTDEDCTDGFFRCSAGRPGDYVTVVLPEFVPAKWWHHLFHNQRALLIKGALLFRKNTVVADVPYLLKR